MNNELLPREHGYPIRLFVPGKYGMKCPKWIKRIEIMQPAKNAYIAKLPLKIKGFASSGAGIKRVLISLDGASWEEAKIRHTVESKKIAAWEYELNKMANRILSMAEDLSGSRQEIPYEVKVRNA